MDASYILLMWATSKYYLVVSQDTQNSKIITVFFALFTTLPEAQIAYHAMFLFIHLLDAGISYV
jgi:hypothetical protein